MKKLFIVLVVLILFVSCSSKGDDDSVKGQKDNSEPPNYIAPNSPENQTPSVGNDPEPLFSTSFICRGKNDADFFVWCLDNKKWFCKEVISFGESQEVEYFCATGVWDEYVPKDENDLINSSESTDDKKDAYTQIKPTHILIVKSLLTTSEDALGNENPKLTYKDFSDNSETIKIAVEESQIISSIDDIFDKIHR